MKASKYNIFLPYEERFAIFNGLTKRFFLVSKQNFDSFQKILHFPDEDERYFAPFIKRMRDEGFIIDDDINELDIVRQQYEHIRHTDIYKLMILPTYSCNVACWYCTQHHRKIQLKDYDVSLIKRHIVQHLTLYQLKGLCLSWFGGEPLLCFHHIEEISKFAQKFCEEHGMTFENTITTNGILLTREKILKMRDLNFRFFQITIDGTQEVHDKVKVLKNQSAFVTTLNNICLTTELIPDVEICLRYNYTSKNLNVKEVVDELKKRLPETVRNHISLSFMKVWQEDEQQINYEPLTELVRHESKSWFAVSIGGSGVCYVENDHYNCIFPNGKVDKCNNIDPDTCRGYIDKDGMIKWNSPILFPHITPFTDSESRCLECQYLPLCFGPCPKEREEYHSAIGHLSCRYRNADKHWEQHIKCYITNCLINH